MNFNGFVIPDSTFYDSKNYPHGFSRGGEFTLKQAKMLNVLGKSLLALSIGQKKADTAEELQFMRVCSGEALPQSDIEKTWKKYLSSINRPL